MTAPRDPAAGATPAREETEVSADDVRVVAAFLRQKRDSAVREGRGVMLSWDDANGFALVLDAAANALAALRERDAAREDAESVEWLMAHASYVQLGNEALHATVVFDVPRGMDLRSALRAARAATAEGRTP